MSTFTNYEDSSKHYDNQRQPLGADNVLDAIRRYSNKAISELRMLDSGCGTGNYAKALLDRGIRNLTLTDASSGMLNRARAKFARAVQVGTIEEIKQSKLPDIPFKDSSFDVVMFSLVLHHLEPANGSYNQLESVIRNAYRVLDDEGVMVIIAQVENDLKNNWYYNLNENITQKYCAKFAPEDVYMRYFRQTGFKLMQTAKVCGRLLVEHDRVDGPFDQSWRACDSFWSVATDEEIKDVQNKINAMRANNSLEEWVQQKDRTVKDGIITIFVCKK